jgi:amidase
MFAATEETRGTPVLPPVGLVTAPGSAKLKGGVLLKGFSGAAAHPEVAAAVQAAAKTLEASGHTIVGETDWPTPQPFQDDFLASWSLGAAQDMAGVEKLAGRKPDETLAEPFALAMAANAAKMTPADIEGVQQRLVAAATAYDDWIKGFDVVLSPVFTSPPSPLGFLRGDVPFEELRQRLLHEVGYTLIHNVSGAPAISLPLGQSQDGLPIGVQVSSAYGGERTLLELAYEFETSMPWSARRAVVWAG